MTAIMTPTARRTQRPVVETDRWPMLDPTPTGPRAEISAAIARRLFNLATRRLGITVSRDGSPADLVLRRPDEFFARLGRDGLIGFGESYLTGAWEADDIGAVLTLLARDIAGLVPDWMQRLRATWVRTPPAEHRNTEDNTRGNIGHHYDLSNDLFTLFLDESLSYSAALFQELPSREPLATAQVRKIERLLDAAGVTAGSTVLEIGTGWGELAIRAAARGATVRSVTLSSEQLALAEQRISAAGFADRVSVELLDYRAVDGEYDAIVSVEMIEAVGHEYWATYFAKLDSLLSPGGRVCLQAITMPHARMLATRSTYTWINKYIFPGGFLPSTEVIDQLTRDHTDLRVTDRLCFGQHYAETLRRWDLAFLAQAARVRALGFDERFQRMWHFYLEYSRAGFASGYLDVQQITLARGSR